MALSLVGTASAAWGCNSQCIQANCGYLSGRAFNSCVDYGCGCSQDVQQKQQQICIYTNEYKCNNATDVNSCLAQLNKDCMVNQLALFQNLKCTDTITNAECKDLKKIALISTTSDQKSIARTFSSTNKDTLQRLLALKLKQKKNKKQDLPEAPIATAPVENPLFDASYASEYVSDTGYYFVEAKSADYTVWYFYDGTYVRYYNNGTSVEGVGRPTHPEVDQYNLSQQVVATPVPTPTYSAGN